MEGATEGLANEAQLILQPFRHWFTCVTWQAAHDDILYRNERQGWSVRVQDGSRSARMNLLSMYDRALYYPTRPELSSQQRNG